MIYLRDHVTGDGLAAALLLCAALEGRPLTEVAAVMPRYPQAKENVRVASQGADTRDRARRSSAGTPNSAATGRVLVRPSGTEPLIRVLVEAEDAGGGRRGLC